MFQIPKWEDDVPKSNLDFGVKKKRKEKQKDLNSSLEITKTNKNNVSITRNTNKPFTKTNPKKYNNIPRETNNNTRESKLKTNHATKSNTTNIKSPNKYNNKPRETNKNRRQIHENKLRSNHANKRNNSNTLNNKSPTGIPDKSVRKEIKVQKNKVNRKRNHDDTFDKMDLQNLDTDKLDQMFINVKKKKFNESIENDDNENMLFNEKGNSSRNKNKCVLKKNNVEIEPSSRLVEKNVSVNRKKEKLKQMLQSASNRSHIRVTGNKLRERMLQKLKSAQFRYLNEKLYTSSGTEAKDLFQTDPSAFETYHQGYQQQIKKWPVNPLDVIIKRILQLPKSHLIADLGCGEAALSKRVPHTVRSFDLVANNPAVEVCDMAHTPLLGNSVDVTVYCLALMGTELTQYLVEANRILKKGGLLLIAEVESRFDDVNAFTQDVQRLGFKLKKLDNTQQVFFFMEFMKNQEPPVKRSKLPQLTLKPCIYKRR